MRILLKYWRELLILILIIILVISFRSCSNKKSDIDLLKKANDSTYHVAIAHKLKNGQLAFQVKTYEATVSQLRNDASLFGFDKKALQNQVGSLGNLVAYWKGRATLTGIANSRAADTTIVYLYRGDSVRQKEKVFNWSNHYLTLHEIYNPATDSIFRRYTYQTDFTLTPYRKGMGFLKRKQLVTDVTFSDPNMKVGKFQGIVIKEGPKKWYQTTAFKVGAGIALGAFLARR